MRLYLVIHIPLLPILITMIVVGTHNSQSKYHKKFHSNHNPTHMKWLKRHQLSNLIKINNHETKTKTRSLMINQLIVRYDYLLMTTPFLSLYHALQIYFRILLWFSGVKIDQEFDMILSEESESSWSVTIRYRQE